MDCAVIWVHKKATAALTKMGVNEVTTLLAARSLTQHSSSCTFIILFTP